MAKKEIIAFDPPTEEEIALIQPNNVTLGSITYQSGKKTS